MSHNVFKNMFIFHSKNNWSDLSNFPDPPNPFSINHLQAFGIVLTELLPRTG
jgi:hypothetical protein